MNDRSDFDDLFADAPRAPERKPPPPWKLLVVDDEPDIHSVFRLTLRHAVVLGRPLQLLGSGSAAEARSTLAAEPDIALVLLDVVMESDRAGLDLVEHIRGQLKNTAMQIVLVTGQPGYAPQRQIVERYTINGYVLKSELDTVRIFAMVNTALRTHQALLELERQKRELAASERRYVDLYDHSPDMYATVAAANAEIRQCNQTLADKLGYRKEEIIGRPVFDLYHPDCRTDAEAAFRTLLETGEMHNAELQLRRKDGDRLHVNLNGTAERDAAGRALHGRCCWIDITPLKRAENAIKRLNQQLERRVAERTEQLQAANAELTAARDHAQRANKAKSVFLANMSHELRTPMNAILGFTQLMLRDPDLGDEQRRNLATIHRSGEHLLSLINDVLEISRIETGRMELMERPFALFDMLDEVEKMTRVRAAAKGIDLQVSLGPELPRHVAGDDHRLRQVLLNLLGNAVKFTDQGTVTLRVTRAAQTADADAPVLAFAVNDSGCGVAAEDQTRIFEPFVQADAGERSGTGTGLGLTISRDFVRLMGGELSVRSQPGNGSEFYFAIPLKIVDAPAADRRGTMRYPVALAPGQPAYRMLVAEDKADNRLLLRRLLEQIGFQVQEASNGEEAIAVFHQWHPHLIWMDMRMPVLDGYEATRRIKATPEGRKTVVIAQTASVFEEDQRQVLAAGCADFVRKPLDPPEIFAMIERYLNVRYEYDEPAGEAAEPVRRQTIEQGIDKLPEPMRRDLQTSAIELDIQRAGQIVEEIRGIDHDLGCAIAELLQEFRLDELQRLIDKPG